jgi:hypothetical protein
MWRDILVINWIFGMLILLGGTYAPAFPGYMIGERDRQGRSPTAFFLIMFVSTLIAALFWELMMIPAAVRFLKWLGK